MTTNLFLAVKSNWRVSVEFARHYIKQPERLHSKDLIGVLDQIWAEEMIIASESLYKAIRPLTH